MRTEYKIFGIVTTFLFLASALYWWWSGIDLGKPDLVGTLALAMSGVLCLMCSGYFWFVSRRIDPRPEDRDDAEIIDGAGDVGFFSPGSYYPFGIGVAAFFAGIGLVFFYWWLIAAGILALLILSAGLLFEYYTGARRAH